MVDDTGASGPTLAAKLERLFRTVRPRGKAEHSCEDVATALRAAGGPTISGTYVWQLRKGLRDNPTKHHLEALAAFFGVSPAYFLDDGAADRIDAELDLLVALRDAPVRQIALRSIGLSPESLSTITEVIERVRILEGVRDQAEEGPT